MIIDNEDAESVATTRAPGDLPSSLVSPFGRTGEAGEVPPGFVRVVGLAAVPPPPLPRANAPGYQAPATAPKSKAKAKAKRAPGDPNEVFPIRNPKWHQCRRCDSCREDYHYRNCERNIVPLFHGAWWSGTSHERYFLVREDGEVRSDVSYIFQCYKCKAFKDGTDFQTALRAIYGRSMERHLARSMAWSEAQTFIQGVLFSRRSRGPRRGQASRSRSTGPMQALQQRPPRHHDVWAVRRGPLPGVPESLQRRCGAATRFAPSRGFSQIGGRWRRWRSEAR